MEGATHTDDHFQRRECSPAHDISLRGEAGTGHRCPDRSRTGVPPATDEPERNGDERDRVLEARTVVDWLRVLAAAAGSATACADAGRVGAAPCARARAPVWLRRAELVARQRGAAAEGVQHVHAAPLVVTSRSSTPSHSAYAAQTITPITTPAVQSVTECMPVYRRPKTTETRYTLRPAIHAPSAAPDSVPAVYRLRMCAPTKSTMDAEFVECVDGKPYSR
jgi:hypothetical protein